MDPYYSYFVVVVIFIFFSPLNCYISLISLFPKPCIGPGTQRASDTCFTNESTHGYDSHLISGARIPCSEPESSLSPTHQTAPWTDANSPLPTLTSNLLPPILVVPISVNDSTTLPVFWAYGMPLSLWALPTALPPFPRTQPCLSCTLTTTSSGILPPSEYRNAYAPGHSAKSLNILSHLTLTITPSYKWGNWGTERLSSLPKLIWLVWSQSLNLGVWRQSPHHRSPACLSYNTVLFIATSFRLVLLSSFSSLPLSIFHATASCLTF